MAPDLENGVVIDAQHSTVLPASTLVWRTFFEATERLRNAIERALRDEYNLHMADYNLLEILSEAPHGSMRLGDLARRLAFSPSRLSYQIRVLEERGLITRKPSTTDGRGAIAEITEAGATLFKEAQGLYADQLNTVLQAVLDPGDETQIVTIFQRVNSRLATSARMIGWIR